MSPQKDKKIFTKHQTAGTTWNSCQQNDCHCDQTAYGWYYFLIISDDVKIQILDVQMAVKHVFKSKLNDNLTTTMVTTNVERHKQRYSGM